MSEKDGAQRSKKAKKKAKKFCSVKKSNNFKKKTMDPLTIGAITAGVSALGQGANILATQSTNKKTREWNERMYQLQRQHSLADWTMQNEYNSPAAQMKRLESAGLNPHLVYGKGTVDNFGGNVRSADTGSWNPETPNYNFGQSVNTGLNAIYDTQLKAAQIDNLKAQNNVIVTEAALKAAQIAQTTSNTKKTGLETTQLEQLIPISLDAAKANLRKTIVDTDVSLQANERAQLSNAQSLQQGVENILLSRAQQAKTLAEKSQINQQIQNLKSDNTLKNLDINLKRLGVQPSDNIFLRAGAQYLKQSGISIDKAKNWGKTLIKSGGWKW